MPFKKIILLSCLLWLAGPGACLTASAYVMGSSNYRVEKDSVNIGGSDNGSSTSYRLKETLGEVATGDSGSANFNLHGGYRQMDEIYLALSVPGGVTLAPSLGGITGGTADGNGTWNTKTDDPAGYSLSLKATSSPALKSGTNFFPDYTPAVSGVPDYGWSLGSADAEFGFAPFNAQSQVAKYKNDGANCSLGGVATDGVCWNGLTVANEQIANRTSRTDTGGESTKINFRAQISGLQASGVYQATVVVTATAN